MSAAPILAAFRQAFAEAWAGGAGALLPLGFLGGAAVLVPLGIGSETETLRAVGPGIIWVSLALSSLVTLERIFQADVEDGTLDLWLQTGAPMAGIAAVVLACSATAVSWHGVLLAEVARIAPAGEVAGMTGGVLAFGNAGEILLPYFKRV